MGTTVLIAEDDENDALLLKRAIKRAGIETTVHIVGDGEEAIHYMKGEGRYSDRNTFSFPRVLITDLKMPRKDGFALLEWLKDHPECKVVPVIVLSTSNHSSDVARCYQLGANAYFQKPGSLDELSDLIKLNLEYWQRSEIPPVGSHMRCSA